MTFCSISSTLNLALLSATCFVTCFMAGSMIPDSMPAMRASRSIMVFLYALFATESASISAASISPAVAINGLPLTFLITSFGISSVSSLRSSDTVDFKPMRSPSMNGCASLSRNACSLPIFSGIFVATLSNRLIVCVLIADRTSISETSRPSFSDSAVRIVLIPSSAPFTASS